MKTEDAEPHNEKHPSRRDFLRWGLLGAGALLGTAGVYTVVEHTKTPEYLTERSNEFSKIPDWRQDFSDMPEGRIDSSLWHYDTAPEVPGYNNEQQGYTDWLQNVRIEEGTGLVIEAHEREYRYPNDPEGREYQYTSGRIDTRNSLSFEYGKIEAVMKLPSGEGAWPAFWLLSGNEVHTINEDFSEEQKEEEGHYTRDGEVDILESRGSAPNIVEATVHTFNNTKANGDQRGKTRAVTVKDATHTFHTYGAEITPENIIFTIDNVPFHTFVKKSENPDDWPFGNNNQFYVILNLAMGGDMGGKINPANGPWRLEVADLAFYNYTGNR